MYKKVKLKYDSLEPYIDDTTLYIHYDKYCSKYLSKVNEILDNIHYDYQYSLEEIPKNIKLFDSSIRGELLYNVGGILNHILYFNNIILNGKKEPTGAFKILIDNKYGSYNNFVMNFIEQANNLKGSGFTFLVLNNNELEIINLASNDTPYNYGMVPLIALDMWEHAYYLKYQNNKEQYIKNFFSIINMEEVELRYDKEIQKN